MTDRIFEVTPDELVESDEAIAKLKAKLDTNIQVKRQLRERKHQKELFDPNKPQGKTNV